MRFLLLFLLCANLQLAGQFDLSSIRIFQPDIIDFRANSKGVALGDKLIFPARTTNQGVELWVSDGTTSGTIMLADLFPGPESSLPQDLFVADTIVLFVASTPNFGLELYRTDGTPEGTTLVKDIFPGINSGFASVLGDRFYQWREQIYFAAQNTNNNIELWATDGSSEGTVQVADIGFDPAPEFDLSSNPANFIGNDHFLFFTADDGISGPEVWRYNGDDSLQVSDITMPLFGIAPTNLTLFHDYLYFAAGPGAGESDLYRITATPAPAPTPELVFNFTGSGLSLLRPAQGPFNIIDSLLVFPAGQDLNVDIWVSNGTTNGTRILLDTQLGEPSDRFQPTGLTYASGLVYYVDEVPESGTELWRTDGTPSGTFQVKDLIDGQAGSFDIRVYAQEHLGNIYFSANGTIDQSNDETGQELYTSEGTNCTTFLVEDINAGEVGSSPYHFVSVEEQLFFFANNQTGQAELFVLTGTPLPPVFPALSFTVDSLTTLDCNGDGNGFARFTVNGGAGPYTFNGTSNLSGHFEIDNLSGGNYSLPVTDCRDSTLTVSFEIAQPDSLQLYATALTGQNSIEGGTIVLGASGGTPPYLVNWADTSLTSSSREDLAFGTYIATLTDANGCTKIDSFVIEDLTTTYTLSDRDFQVYPTLVNTQVRIEMANNQFITNIEILSLDGRQVTTLSGQFGSGVTLTSDQLPRHNSMYLLTIRTARGESGTARIIISR